MQGVSRHKTQHANRKPQVATRESRRSLDSGLSTLDSGLPLIFSSSRAVNMRAMRPRILVVDDDERIAASVRRALIYEGYQVDVEECVAS